MRPNREKLLQKYDNMYLKGLKQDHRVCVPFKNKQYITIENKGTLVIRNNETPTVYANPRDIDL